MKCLLLLGCLFAAGNHVSAQCTTTFTPVTASVAFANLNPGWNLGNSLDAEPDETSWGNPLANSSTFENVQAKGFKSIRIPVTWAYHFVTASPAWLVNTTWMDRVETVVDEALATGMSVVLNVHHDASAWADYTAANANITQIEEQFRQLWSQIATRFACKSSKLIFEPLNEPPGSGQADADELNKLNDIFLDEVNKAGNFNPQRVVSLSGLGMDFTQTSQYFERGNTYPDQPWGLQVHYYSPYDFIFLAWGKTIWGSDADKLSLLNDFQLLNGNFTDVPVFIGEWSATTIYTETAARWKYFDYFIQTCNAFGYSSMLWDNGGDQYDRVNNVWRDPPAIDILMNAVAGTNNSLADSTTDTSASAQTSSEYLFHKVGDEVVDQSVAYLLNGNTITSISNSSGSFLDTLQYSVSGDTVTFSAAYLSTLYTSTSPAGIIETLTVSFRAGATLSLEIVQYDTPTFPTTTFPVDPSADLYIPVTYAGLPRVATVTAVGIDGTYVDSSWTVYLGPLQQARWTYGDYDFDSEHFIVRAAGLQEIMGLGETVILTVEFFPRGVGENSVNITMTL